MNSALGLRVVLCDHLIYKVDDISIMLCIRDRFEYLRCGELAVDKTLNTWVKPICSKSFAVIADLERYKQGKVLSHITNNNGIRDDWALVFDILFNREW
jgi:hypothetical protein